MKATAEIAIESSMRSVWDYVSDVSNMDNWVDGVQGAHLISDGNIGEGAELASKYHYRGKTFDVKYKVTRFESPRYFGMKSTEGPFPFEGILELQEEGPTTTRLYNTIDAGSDSWMTSIIFVIGAPLIKVMMRRQLAKELSNLERILSHSGG